LLVLDYCLHVGSEEVVRRSKDNIYIIKTLREFQYIDEENKDQGMSGTLRRPSFLEESETDKHVMECSPHEGKRNHRVSPG
jgi:hypothetical protein